MTRIFGLVLLFLLVSCSNDGTNRNPYLQEIGFRFEMNLNLPLYSPLTNTGSAVYVNTNVEGSRGIFVINTGFDNFMAWEASCPNHVPNTCSTMVLNGQTVTCSCEDYEYNLFTGQMLNRPDDGKRYHDLLFYKAIYGGNIVTVSN